MEISTKKRTSTRFKKRSARETENTENNGKIIKGEREEKTKKTRSASPKQLKKSSDGKKRTKQIKSDKGERDGKRLDKSLKQTEKTIKQGAKPRFEKGGKSSGKAFGKGSVKIVFLGGVGEIGKNMTAIEYGDDIVIVDAGAIFPTEETPGIDLVVPDITYLLENSRRIKGVLLTHGHEDHIGGVPYLLKEIKVPVIGTKLTLALVDNKLREHKINDAKEIVVAPDSSLQLGAFKVRFINVNHSIAGSLALVIETPAGVIFHSGDFKIDLTPVAGEPIDLKAISDVGAAGVLLYMGESTNIERTGYTASETVVGNTLDRLFAENAAHRLIIATFASNVHRLQQIFTLAQKYKRKVALSGRSMINVVDAAEKIGELSVPDEVFVDITKTKNMRDSELVIISTGSQGEPMSALTRMANGENPQVTVGKNDTVIISASPIPGNEKLVYRVINNLYRKGAKVVYESLEQIHVSGHACQEEHKIMHTLLKPKYFIPVHGEYRHLKKHANLAESLGMSESKILIPDIGNRIEVSKNGLRRLENVPSGSRLIDGEGIEDEKASVVIEDRRQLSEEGLFIVSVAVSGGEVVGEPAINSRGFVFDFHHDYNREMRQVINRAIEGYDLQSGSVDELKRVIKKALRNYLLKKTRQSPMVVPVVVEL